MKYSIKYVLIIGGILIGAVAGVGIYLSSTNDTGTAPTSQTPNDAVTTNAVTLKGFAFEPATITVKKGTKVTWTNDDRVEHTVTSKPGAPVSFDSGRFGQGKTYSFTFEKPGTYEYYCMPHPYMKGTVVVTES